MPRRRHGGLVPETPASAGEARRRAEEEATDSIMALQLPMATARVAGADHTAAPWLAKPQFEPADCVPQESVCAYQAQLILWKGYCSVHARFSVEQIAAARAKHPGGNIIVHPECRLEFVQAADCDGSTELIIDTITAAPAGTSWGVGTEINLVNRLNAELPDKHVFCLDPVICRCSTMYRMHPASVLWSLEHLAQGRVVNQITVDSDTARVARVALDRMPAVP